MKINRKLMIIATVASVAFGSFNAADAQYSRSGGSSTPSTPSAPAASSGYSRPSAPPVAIAPPQQAAPRPPSAPPPVSQASPGQGYSRPGAAAVGAAAAVGTAGAIGASQTPSQERPYATTTQQPQSAMSQAQSRNMSATSLQAYQAERAQAQQPPTPVTTQQVRQDPIYAGARNSFGGNPDRYYSQRTTVINNYRTTHPEVFTYSQNLRPNYGIFDSSFLTGMMVGAIGTSLYDRATWMSSQQHQPWYPQYRADLERQAKDNAELRTRLDEMDREINNVRAQNRVPPQPQAIPQGIDPAMAIAPEAVNADVVPANNGHRSGNHAWIWIVLGLGIFGVIAWVVVKKR